jgi:hypothetical protein
VSNDDLTVAVIKLDSDEHRALAFRMAMTMYLGEACKYCGKVFETLEDLRDVVYAGYHDRGRTACRSCWEANNPPPSNECACGGDCGCCQ